MGMQFCVQALFPHGRFSFFLLFFSFSLLSYIVNFLISDLCRDMDGPITIGLLMNAKKERNLCIDLVFFFNFILALASINNKIETLNDFFSTAFSPFIIYHVYPSSSNRSNRDNVYIYMTSNK